MLNSAGHFQSPSLNHIKNLVGAVSCNFVLFLVSRSYGTWLGPVHLERERIDGLMPAVQYADGRGLRIGESGERGPDGTWGTATKRHLPG